VVPDVKPTLRCFVAWPSRDGRILRAHVVTLDEAEHRKREGWAVIGPDPHDEIELAAWYRRHEDDGA
jgi:hypothetical protein